MRIVWALLISMILSASASSHVMPAMKLRQSLERRGYSPDSFESIKAALRDSNEFTRRHACELLSYRPGQDSLKVLKPLLDDASHWVRMSAADALLILGDRSGFETVVKEWERLVPPDVREDPALMTRIEAYDLGFVLHTGWVLAEFGDGRGLPLASRAALDASHAANRLYAVAALTESLKLNKEEQRKYSIDPADVLRRVAESEQDHVVLDTTRACLEKAPADVAVPILEVLVRSPHLTGTSKGAAEHVLQMKQAEARGELPASRPMWTVTASRPASTRPTSASRPD